MPPRRLAGVSGRLAPADATRYPGIGILLGSALLALILALAIGGGAAALLLDDPGPVVRYGLPLVKLIVDLGVSVAVGSLVLATFAVGEEKALGRALDLAAIGAIVWTAAAAITGLLTFLSVTGIAFSLDESFGSQLGYFLTSIPAGQAWLVTTLIGAAVTVLCFAVRSRSALVLVVVLAGAGIAPMAETGHSALAGDHELAVTALGLHLGFAAVWLGGLLCLAVLGRAVLGAHLLPVVERYSGIALLCFIVVAVSGYVSAEIRVGSLDRLATPYGVLVLIKVIALLGLGLLGALHRRHTIRRLAAGDGRAFWRLVLAELAVMGIATGVAAGLARTASPVPETVAAESTTPSSILTGEPLPPTLTPLRLLTEGRLDLVWALAVALGLAAYLGGVLLLRRKGETWPMRRVVAGVLAAVVLAYATCGAPGRYGTHLLSMELLQLGLLLGVAPVLLVVAAPVALLRRTSPTRTDESRGVGGTVLAVVDSPVAKVLRSPLPAAVIVAMAAIIPFSPILKWMISDSTGREVAPVLLLAVGVLVADGALSRWTAPRWQALAAAAVPLIAWVAASVVLATGEGLLLVDWYGAMGWPGSALTDQQRGGLVLLLAVGVPLLALTVAAAVRPLASGRTPRDPAGGAESSYRAMLSRTAGTRT